MATINTHGKRRPWMPERKPFSGERRESNHSFYTSRAWRMLRAQFLADHPLCVECLKQHLAVPATVVDHIKPINQGGAALDAANLQSLCSSCHNKKSAAESRWVR